MWGPIRQSNPEAAPYWGGLTIASAVCVVFGVTGRGLSEPLGRIKPDGGGCYRRPSVRAASRAKPPGMASSSGVSWARPRHSSARRAR